MTDKPEANVNNINQQQSAPIETNVNNINQSQGESVEADVNDVEQSQGESVQEELKLSPKDNPFLRHNFEDKTPKRDTVYEAYIPKRIDAGLESYDNTKFKKVGNYLIDREKPKRPARPQLKRSRGSKMDTINEDGYVAEPDEELEEVDYYDDGIEEIISSESKKLLDVNEEATIDESLTKETSKAYKVLIANAPEKEPDKVVQSWDDGDNLFPNVDVARKAIAKYRDMAMVCRSFGSCCEEITGIPFNAANANDSRNGSIFSILLGGDNPVKVAEWRKEIFLAHQEDGARLEKLVSKITNYYLKTNHTDFDLNTEEGVFGYINYNTGLSFLENYFQENPALEEKIFNTVEKRNDFHQKTAYSFNTTSYVSQQMVRICPDLPTSVLQTAGYAPIIPKEINLKSMTKIAEIGHMRYDVTSAGYDVVKNGGGVYDLHLPRMMAGNTGGNANAVYDGNVQNMSYEKWVEQYVKAFKGFESPRMNTPADAATLTLATAENFLFEMSVVTMGTGESISNVVNEKGFSNDVSDQLEKTIYVGDKSLKTLTDEYMEAHPNNKKMRDVAQVAIMADALANPEKVVSQVLFKPDENNKLKPELAVYKKSYTTITRAASIQPENKEHPERTLALKQGAAVQGYYERNKDSIIADFKEKNPDVIKRVDSVSFERNEQENKLSESFIQKGRLFNVAKAWTNDRATLTANYNNPELPMEQRIEARRQCVFTEAKLVKLAAAVNKEAKKQNILEEGKTVTSQNLYGLLKDKTFRLTLSSTMVNIMVANSEEVKKTPILDSIIGDLKETYPKQAEKLDYVNSVVVGGDQNVADSMVTVSKFTSGQVATARTQEVMTELAESKGKDWYQTLGIVEDSVRNEQGEEIGKKKRFVNSISLTNPEQTKQLADADKPFALSQSTKDGIIKVVEKMKSYGIVPDPTKEMLGEEGIKVYGFGKLGNQYAQIEEYLDEDNIDEAYKVAKECEEVTKPQYRDLLDTCAEVFGKRGQMPGNLDIARNSQLPGEFSTRVHESSQLNGIYEFLIACEKRGIDYKQALDDPKKVFDSIPEDNMAQFAKAHEVFSPAKAMVFGKAHGSIADIRGLDAINCLEQNPEQAKKNELYTVYLEGMRALTSSYGTDFSPLFTKLENKRLVVDKHAIKSYMAAGDKYPITEFMDGFVNPKTGKTIGPFDLDKFAREDTRSLTEIKDDLVKKCYDTCTEAAALREKRKKHPELGINMTDMFNEINFVTASSSYMLDVMKARNIDIDALENDIKDFILNPEKSLKAYHKEAEALRNKAFHSKTPKKLTDFSFEIDPKHMELTDYVGHMKNDYPDDVGAELAKREAEKNYLSEIKDLSSRELSKTLDANRGGKKDLASMKNYTKLLPLLRNATERYKTHNFFGKFLNPAAYYERSIIKQSMQDLKDMGISDNEINGMLGKPEADFKREILGRRDKHLYELAKEKRIAEENSNKIEINNNNKKPELKNNEPAIDSTEQLRGLLDEDINISGNNKNIGKSKNSTLESTKTKTQQKGIDD